jgi:hypothetical protein
MNDGIRGNEPNASPVRREPLPYNIWDNRSEGTATAVEELVMHAGLYDDNRRAREFVWIMLAQRCARGLASLYAQANGGAGMRRPRCDGCEAEELRRVTMRSCRARFRGRNRAFLVKHSRNSITVVGFMLLASFAYGIRLPQ